MVAQPGRARPFADFVFGRNHSGLPRAWRVHDHYFLHEFPDGRCARDSLEADFAVGALVAGGVHPRVWLWRSFRSASAAKPDGNPVEADLPDCGHSFAIGRCRWNRSAGIFFWPGLVFFPESFGERAVAG